MKVAAFEMDPGVLAARDEGFPLDLCVSVELDRGELFGVRIRRLPVECYTEPVDPARKPTPAEGAEVLAALVKDMLIGERRAASGMMEELNAIPEPDFAVGWKAYREELRDTGCAVLPAWEKLPPEVREAFCCAIRAAYGREDRWGLSEKVISDQSAVISEEALSVHEALLEHEHALRMQRVKELRRRKEPAGISEEERRRLVQSQVPPVLMVEAGISGFRIVGEQREDGSVGIPKSFKYGQRLSLSSKADIMREGKRLKFEGGAR